jgi:CheY-like chemotaxis protein
MKNSNKRNCFLTLAQHSKMEDYRVLIVDDCLVSVKVLRGKLRQALLNVKIDIASNGEDGLNVFRKFPNGHYTAIITDFDMPLMDGSLLTMSLRSAGFNGFIFGVSGGFQAKEKFLTCGANEFYLKPLEGDNFQDLVTHFKLF